MLESYLMFKSSDGYFSSKMAVENIWLMQCRATSNIIAVNNFNDLGKKLSLEYNFELV